jgi:amino acid transporter
MGVVNILFGRPLASDEDQGERITPSQGVPTFGLDALSSAAYGPEAALTILLPLGLAGVHYVAPLTAAIVVLLLIVYFSYRQTIAAYPGGGGSYTVAKENLGSGAGLLAAAALMIDYLLNVAVGISAGIGALVSAVPSLQRYTLPMCLAVLAILTVVNLRGVREAGSAFIAPTYLFVGTLGVVIAIGVFHVIVTGGHPRYVDPYAAHAPAAAGTVGLWLLLRAFASGCTALTGVEAVSNGVQAFREPVVPAARKTLTIIVLTLIFLLGGIATLVYYYGIAATDPGQPGYQSVLSLVTAAVAGRGALYGLTMFSVLLVLCLSANTSFADFPRLCRAVAMDDYLPHSLTVRGRRLVYSQGIWVLTLLAAVLLIVFGGVTDRLIPLFAVGAFLAFTLSQAGMVVHWLKNSGSWHHVLVNGIGAAATGVTVLVVVAAKFMEGAWIVVLLLPAAILLMARVQRHYQLVALETEAKGGLLGKNNQHPPIVIVPIERWNTATQKTLRFAMTLSPEVHAVHVACGEDDSIAALWQSTVEQPALAAGVPVPRLITLHSPYRLVLRPVVDYVLQVEKENCHRTIAVAISTMVERHWYHYFLHNQRSEVLTAMLLLEGDRRIDIINVPWYLRA